MTWQVRPVYAPLPHVYTHLATTHVPLTVLDSDLLRSQWRVHHPGTTPPWSSERQIPPSKGEIEDIFLDLTQKLGVLRDSMRNMVSAFPLSHAPNLVEPRPRGLSLSQSPFPAFSFLIGANVERGWNAMRSARAPFSVAP